MLVKFLLARLARNQATCSVEGLKTFVSDDDGGVVDGLPIAVFVANAMAHRRAGPVGG